MKIALSSIVLFSMLCGIAWSQRRPMPNEEESEPKPTPRKKVKGPRAVGVIEIAPNGKARLVPIAILVGGEKWFDAGVYMADPQPMALEPETVYEGEVAGDSAGLFTITGLATIGNNFVGLGTWKPAGSEEPKKKIALQPTMPTGSLTAEDDERPKLKRPKPANADTKKDAPPQPPPATPAPTAGTDGAKQANSTPAAADKKSAEPPAPKPARSSEEDANRPRLRRGTAGVEQAEGIALPSAASDFATAPAKPGTPAAPPVNFKRIAAISDAGGPQPRSYIFHANPGEAADYKRKMIPLAQESLQKFIALRMKGVQAPAITDQNSKLQIFDISSNNDPVLVLTVRIPANESVPTQQAARPKTKLASRNEPALKPAPAAEYDATIVARVSLSGELRKVFENVTDSTRLDAYPKMDLIDAIDANGDSVGELLFREQYDRGHAYVIYRVGLDKLWPLFEGEQKQF